MIKEMEISLGGVISLAIPVSAGALVASGWYTDPSTGQAYYYDANTGQWYVYAAGLLYPMSLPSNTITAPWTKLSVGFGSTIKFNLSYKYRGPGGKGFTLYAAVGNNVAGGGEWAGFAASKSISPSTVDVVDWKTIVDSIDVVMGQAGYPTHSGETGAIYFKIEAQWLSPAYLNAIYVVTAAGEFGELTITSIAKV